MTPKSTTQKAAQSRTSQSSKGKSKSGIEALLEAVRFAVDAYRALQSISVKFDEREKEGMRKLVYYSKMHAQKIVAGGKPDNEALEKTMRLAGHVAENLEERFEAIMNDSFILFDKGMEAIRKNAPDILVRDGDKIVALQNALRHEINRTDSTYDDTIDAYKAMMGYLPTVSKEAEAVVERERQRQRDERRVAMGQAILEELDGLEID